MRYYIVEGTIKDAKAMNDSIMKEHMAYTQEAMDEGKILMSGLKSDMSGGVFIARYESEENLRAYLEQEPFGRYGIQDYRWTEFDAHYLNPSPDNWFK